MRANEHEEGMIIKRSEKNSQKKFEIFFDEMADALFIHDFNGDIKKVNKKTCECLKLTKESLQTMNIANFVSKDVIDSFKELYIKQIKTGQYYHHETNYVSNSIEIPIEITSRPIKFGKTKMILTEFRDISLRKQYENLLIESKKEAESNEDELKLIFDNSPSSIFLFDDKMNVLRVNKKAAIKFNIDYSNISGKKINDIVNCTKADCNPQICVNYNVCKLSNIFSQTAKGINFFKEEVKISIQTDGFVEERTVLISTSLLMRNGHSIYLATIDDITNQKKLELDLIEAKEKAEESDKLKSAFIENLHHEIRTPLNGILGFIDFFADDSYNFSNQEKKELIEVMHKSGDRLVKTINDLLEISKLDSRILKMNNESFDLKIYLDNFIKEQRTKFNNSEIELQYQIDSNLENKLIYTDKIKLQKVLQNLIENAFKFTSKGFVKLKASFKDNNLEILIEDSGIGVAPEFHDLIFKPFWQVNKDRDRYYEGNGLGLAVSKKIVDNIGGELVVKSDLGKGATFCVKFPKNINLSVKSVNEITKIDTIEKSLEGKTILICEDEMSQYIYLKTVLLNENCRLIHASDGIEALEIVKSNTAIDLVLMDLIMPKMNGLEATAKIKQIRGNIPIIAQSALSIDSEKQRVMKAGCIDYLVKPISRDLLINTIAKHLR